MAKILITGGLGFIGSNLSHKLLTEGHDVTIFDNMSRYGCKYNLDWINRNHHSSQVRFFFNDLQDQNILKEATIKSEIIFHLAGQVSVSKSIDDPYFDFTNNAIGTINLLEAARKYANNPIILYSSTNKVYGSLESQDIVEMKSRYCFKNLPFGISETQKLEFQTPYACSKGSADQYVNDYSQTYNLRTIVMRQSCIFGYRQFGNEDQGWVSWFLIAAMLGIPINIYGNGKQLRDVLFIDDLLNAYELAIKNIETTQGKVYNIGGGIENTISIWKEFQIQLDKVIPKKTAINYHPQRLGDQKVFLCDIRRAEMDFRWRPVTSFEFGLEKLYAWLYDNKDVFVKMYSLSQNN